MQRVLRRAQRRAQLLEGRRIAIVAVDVRQVRARAVANAASSSAAVLAQAVAGALLQLVQVPARLGHADDRHVEVAARDQGLQRGKDLLVGQVARGAEEDERVGMLDHAPGIVRTVCLNEPHMDATRPPLSPRSAPPIRRWRR